MLGLVITAILLAKKVKGIVMAELNYGQLVGEVQRAANGQCPVKLCAKYDMTIFEPEEILQSIEELINEVSGNA